MEGEAAILPPSGRKDSGSGETLTTLNGSQRVSFRGSDIHKKEYSNSNHANGALISDSSDRSSATSLPSLHVQLMRTHKKRDPFQYYEILQMLGDGSMGSVCKVKKRKSALGGSARKSFVRKQRRSIMKKILPCLSFCLPGGASEGTKRGALVAAEDYDDAPLHTLDANSETSNTTVSSGDRSKNQHSSIVSYRGDFRVVYALKSIILDQVTNDTFVKELRNEIDILRTLDHPNICKAIETYEFKNQVYLVLELCSGGDLYGRDPYDEVQARHIVHSILDACTFLHRKNITHRDLKYENIMFASPTSPNVKIIDFGLSKKYSQNEILSQTVGTVYTMAPEVIKGKYGELCDVWSIGVIAFMLLSSSVPYFGKSRLDVVKRIMDGRVSFKSRRWKDVSRQAKDFVTSLLVNDANHRPSCSDALIHEWFKGRKVSRANPNFSPSQVVSSAVMDRVQATIQTFAGYTKLKKLALYVIAHKSSADEIGFLQQLFRNRFDVEKDGVISLDEFKEALSVYSYTNDELEAMFHAIDIDGGDSLAYSEFLAATIEAHGSIEEGRIAEAFDRLDDDDTGYITVSNLTDFLGKEAPKEFINEIIEEADVSKDHRIDYDEFLGLWDGSFDKVLAECLKDVREKRVVRCSTFFQALEEGEDGAFLEEEDSVDIDGGNKGDSLESAPPGAGKFFFEQEKEKSMRGIWI